MDLQLPATIAHRRSDRVSIAFPLEVAGVDQLGKRFSERTKTTRVGRYGCCLPLSHLLESDQTIQMRRVGTDETAVGRVVTPLGVHADGRMYGVETRESCEGLWGIRFSSAFYEKLLNNMKESESFLKKERRATYWNDGAERLTGYNIDELIGKDWGSRMMADMDEVDRSLGGGAGPVDGVMQGVEPGVADLYLRQQPGYRVPVSVRVLPIRNSAGSIVGAVEVFSDSTVKLKFDKRVTELEQLAFRDALTGLPNRRYIELKVEQGLQDHQRVGRLYGLLMFDIDRFKQVNDTHGHETGDLLLKAISDSVSRGLRPLDIVGRWGGEEFLVLAPDIDAVTLGDLAERCRVLIAESSVEACLSRVSVTASIGATVLIHSDRPDTVINRVDELMYQSKHSGGDRTTAG